MAQTAPPNNKPLQLDGTPGHGQGLGSGSGAGIWLSGTPPSTTAASGAPAVGRSYHISSQASRPSSQQIPTDYMLRLDSTDSGDLDLDLSFEFVSQLEQTRQRHYETPNHNTADDELMEPSSPRGMSTANWASRLKKQPPSALRLPNKKQLAVNAASPFSPISPLYHKGDGEAPLLILPLGSTRRAIDAGIQSEQVEHPISRAELVQRQRTAAQMQTSGKRSSPVKRRAVLGEIKNKQNVASLEQGDVFNDANRDIKKDMKTSASQVSSWTALNSTSFASALESQTALNVPTIAVNRIMPSENILGLDLTGSNTKSTAVPAPTYYNDADESSPDTAFSPLFDSDTVKSTSDGINTPGTTFSSLFDDRMSSSGDSKIEASTQMKRGLSAPLPNTTQVVNEVIKEEESGSLRRSQSNSADSFLVDLSLMNDGNNDHLKDQHGAISSVSDFGSSPIKGGDRPMIVNTFDSPTTEEVEFLFRKSNQLPPVDESKGSLWIQSPLLLNKQSEQDGNAALALGLGIDMGSKVADHLELDMSELSVERAILPELDAEAFGGLNLGMQPLQELHFAPSKVEAGLVPSSNAKDQITTSPSYVSSVEGFAINITPAGQAASKEVLMPIAYTSELISRSQSKSKWGNKLWNLNPLTSLRSPSRASHNTKRSSPMMKELTLRVDMVQEGYNTVPSSATLPMTSILNPPRAFTSRVRSSRHVNRSSRLRYMPNEDDHVQVDMNSPELNRVSRSAQPETVSRFRTSSSSMTPNMEYVNSTRTRRHSWGCSDTQSWIVAEPVSASKLLEVPVARDSHLYTTLRNSTLSAVLPVEEVYRPMDNIVEDGIRRRTNHRATNSVPSTPTIMPASWATPELYEVYPEQDQYEQEVQFDNSSDDVYARQGRRRRTGAVASTIDIHGPASAIGPYLLGLTGTRNRSKMVKMTGQQHGAYYNTSRRHTQIQLFSDDREQIEGLFASSGRALETSPSRNLFFAGFLAMPWLWFIGGWGLENDGSIYVGRDAVIAPRITQQSYLPEDVDESLATYVSGRDSQQYMNRASMMSARDNGRYAMGTPESIVDMEEQYAEFQRRGKAQSFIEQSTYANDENLHTIRPNIRRATSLLEGSERNSMRPLSRQELRDMADSIAIPVDLLPEEGEEEAPRLHSIDIQDDEHQGGFAYSSQNEKETFSFAHQQGVFAIPGSGWDEYDDKKDGKTKSSKKLNIFQQVKAANTHMLELFVKSSQSTESSLSLANTGQRRKALMRMQTQSSPDHQPILIRAFTNWSRLETFVLWNRIMAVIVSIAVFGAAGVAIFFVVSDW